MATPIPLDKDSLTSALKYIWGQYRTWAMASRTYKNKVTRWRDVVLALSIGGAVLGTLSQQIIPLSGPQSWIVRGLGFISGAALTLAAYFTREIFSPDPEGRAVRARAAAEAFKSQSYLLATGAPPYDTATTTAELFAKTEDVKQALKNLEPMIITEADKTAGILTVPMSVDDYIRLRVDDQIGYYSRQAAANAKKLATGRKISLLLGAISAVLALVSVAQGYIAGWIAVIGTITAAIAARQYSGRYQFLILSYHAASEKLESLKTKWEIERNASTAPNPHHAFILACEEAISSENSAWMAEWIK
jgi:conflict system pore-forming effector with SLATT domain/uncharacterized protein DUF4231